VLDQAALGFASAIFSGTNGGFGLVPTPPTATVRLEAATNLQHEQKEDEHPAAVPQRPGSRGGEIPQEPAAGEKGTRGDEARRGHAGPSRDDRVHERGGEHDRAEEEQVQGEAGLPVEANTVPKYGTAPNAGGPYTNASGAG
jgi:hypothetical protein